MFKKILVVAFTGFLLLNMCGCFLLLAGTAGGAGTAMWLSGKLSQEFNASYEKTLAAAKKALISLKLEVTKESKDENVAQLKSKYSDGREIWIDIHKVTDNSSKVDVRVGGVNSDKAAADKILKKIQRYL